MPLFKLIRKAGDLPLPGPTTRSQEADSIDFKNTYPLNNNAEMAKDMAAFANALGGVILIGTSRDEDPLTYPGVSHNFADKLSNAFADAHAKHLSPKPPIIERVIFSLPDSNNVMLAVNVHPFADQIVGARVDTNVWRFPVRVGAETNDLEPAMLPFYATTVRRNIILLENIDAAKDKIRICFRNPQNQSDKDPMYWPATLHEVVVTKNVVTIHLEEDATRTHRIPLDDIDCVWDSSVQADPNWVVRVLGHFSGSTPANRTYHSNPRNATISR